MIKVKVVGATGYGGIGIIELLLQHPEVELVSLVAREEVGKPISEIYPHLAGFCALPVLAADDPAAQAPVDVVFFATPDGVGMAQAGELLEQGVRVIDYSGDFRFTTLEAFKDYSIRKGTQTDHKSPELLGKNIYGLTELHRDKIKGASLVGNPGCFAVGCTLGLAPAMASGIIESVGAICDCKTGVSGAGKKINPQFHFPARYEQMNAYRLSGHQHVCEIERELGLLAGQEVRLTFTAQVVPVCRGILSTLYGTLTRPVSEEEVTDIYRDFYRDDIFVRIFDSKTLTGTHQVKGTNFCNITVSVDERCNRLRIVSHIDNLMKGQAGSALQNMNVMFGLPETTGLMRPSSYP